LGLGVGPCGCVLCRVVAKSSCGQVVAADRLWVGHWFFGVCGLAGCVWCEGAMWLGVWGGYGCVVGLLCGVLWGVGVCCALMFVWRVGVCVRWSLEGVGLGFGSIAIRGWLCVLWGGWVLGGGVGGGCGRVCFHLGWR